MNNKKLIILATIAVITSILAIWTSSSKQTPTSDPTKPKYLIGNIEPSLITSIKIGTGDETVTLKRGDKQFVIVNKGNYPAEITEINDLVRTCVDIQVTELYTDDPKNHKDLGVLEENASSQVKFFKAGGDKEDDTLLAGVIIGKTKEGGRGTYIRQVGKDEVYVTLNKPRIRSNALDYLDQEMTPAISKQSIDSIEVTQAGRQYTLTTNDEDRIVPDKMLEGKELKDAEVKKVFTALSSLRFTDVSKDRQNLDFNKSYICRLADETTYNLFLVENDGKTYLMCNAIYKGVLPPKSRTVETPEELKDKEAQFLARDNAVKFTTRHSGWIYEISEKSAKSLSKPLDDLFEEPLKPEEPEDPNAPAGPIGPVLPDLSELLKGGKSTTPTEKPTPDSK
jgi:hypothetical protein